MALLPFISAISLSAGPVPVPTSTLETKIECSISILTGGI